MTHADRVILALAVGDATLAGLSRQAGCTRATGASVICRLRAAKRIHICKWVMSDPAGGRMYPRPVYRTGPGVDAEKPARKDRDRSRHKPITRVASVFHLGGLL